MVNNQEVAAQVHGPVGQDMVLQTQVHPSLPPLQEQTNKNMLSARR